VEVLSIRAGGPHNTKMETIKKIKAAAAYFFLFLIIAILPESLFNDYTEIIRRIQKKAAYNIRKMKGFIIFQKKGLKPLFQLKSWNKRLYRISKSPCRVRLVKNFMKIKPVYSRGIYKQV